MEVLKDQGISPANTEIQSENADLAGKIQLETRAKALSIVIPALNEQNYIGDLLTDISSNTMNKNNYEIIVSDNGSTDGTASVVEDFVSGNPLTKIKLVSTPERGVSRARNNGAAASEGEYILFLDADARLNDPEYLEKVLAEMKNRNLDLAGLRPATDSSSAIDHVLCSKFNKLMDKMADKKMPAVIGGAGIVATKDLHEKTGGFDENMNMVEDLDYVSRGLKYGKFGIINSTATIFNNRRFEKEGRFVLCAKYIGAGVLLNHGIKKMPFDFKVGEF